jgi:hypothetical protein
MARNVVILFCHDKEQETVAMGMEDGQRDLPF